jgi:ketosteroid isomerase-like protein
MGPTDTELINTAMNNWKQAFIDQDIDAIMANYSEDFSSERIEGKEQMQDFLQRAIDDGWLENIDINLEIAQLTITDDTADFTPVEFIGDQGEMEIEFTLKKEDKKTWRIIESAPRR